MGLFRTTIEVGNPENTVYHEIKPIVDTGATYSMLPASLLEKTLGLSPTEEMAFTLADGGQVTYGLAEARFRYEGRERTTPVIFGPEGVYFLGAVSLESFGLIADTTRRQLVPSQELNLVGIRQAGCSVPFSNPRSRWTTHFRCGLRPIDGQPL